MQTMWFMTEGDASTDSALRHEENERRLTPREPLGWVPPGRPEPAGGRLPLVNPRRGLAALLDAVHYHPVQEGSPLPISGLVPKIMTEPLENVGAAIAAKDHASFVKAFDALTAACNSCHQAANFGFNVVQRPASNPFPNQVFAPGGGR